MASDEKFFHNLKVLNLLKDVSKPSVDRCNAHSALQSLTKNFRDEQYRELVPHSFLNDGTEFVKLLTFDIKKICETDPQQQLGDEFDQAAQSLEIVTEIYRCFRNCCAGCKRNQLYFHSNGSFLEITRTLLPQLIQVYQEKTPLAQFILPSEKVCLVLQCLYCSVQFLGNLVTDCPENHGQLWSNFKGIFVDLLKLSDHNLTNFICMVLFNCKEERTKQVSSSDGLKILEEILKTISHEDIEWGIYYLEDLMKREELFNYVFKGLQDSERSVLLDFVHAEVSSALDKGDRPVETDTTGPVCHQLPSESLQALGREFKENAHQILSTSHTANEEQSEPKITLQVLGVLCTATSAGGDYKTIQDDTDLLKCCIHLLHAIFMIGQEGDNAFTSKKLSEMTSVERDSDHPAYGLKRDLVRLIGNMVHRNTENQDLVREIGGIPLILDHANIDGRNPFILQWAIFTIHNLCEDNPDNQEVIAKMNLQGVANGAELLRDFGVNASVEDGKIVVKKAEKR